MMEYFPLEITEKQRTNLQTLMEGLASPEIARNYDFNMDRYSNGHGIPDQHECGTGGCALGYGPVLGILPGIEFYEWTDYGNECFTNGQHFLNVWLFWLNWQKTDNTPLGAAHRIKIALEHGVPENHIRQMYGYAPLMYDPLELITIEAEQRTERVDVLIEKLETRYGPFGEPSFLEAEKGVQNRD